MRTVVEAAECVGGPLCGDFISTRETNPRVVGYGRVVMGDARCWCWIYAGVPMHAVADHVYWLDRDHTKLTYLPELTSAAAE